MAETVNYINFEKCKMPKRDEAMKIRKKNAEEHIYKFDFTTLLDIVAARLDVEPISTEEHPSFTLPLAIFDDYFESINIKRSEWMGIINRLTDVLRAEYGYDAYIVIKRQNLTSDIQELVVKL